MDKKIERLAFDIEAVSARRKALQSSSERMLADIRQSIAASQARISETLKHTQGN